MKHLFFLLFVFSFKGLWAQDVDSSQIAQTITLQEKYHVYILRNIGGWGTPAAINYINQVVPNLDSLNLTKAITVTAPSSFIRDAFQRLSQLPEGQAQVYNNAMQDALMPQITNPWLGAQLQSIVMNNFAIRDAGIRETLNVLYQVHNPAQPMSATRSTLSTTTQKATIRKKK